MKLVYCLLLLILSALLFYFSQLESVSNNDNFEFVCNNNYYWISNTITNDCGFHYKKQFGRRSIVFMGDSQSRRLAINYALLVKGITDSARHDMDNFTHNRLEKLFGTNVLFEWAPCMDRAIEKINKIDLLVIYSTSLHYTEDECKNRNFEKDLKMFERQGFDNVVWRIQPDSNSNGEKNMLFVKNTTLNYIDQFTLMKPKMYGNNRLKGNTPNHFHVDGRMALVQHLYNEL